MLCVRRIRLSTAGIALLLAVLFTNAARSQDSVVAVATIKPIHALLAGVMSGIAAPVLLLDGAASPHSYALKPSDVRRLNDARLIVMVSGSLETFMAILARSLPRSTRVAVMDKAPGVMHLRAREGGAFEAHDDAHSGEHGGDHAEGEDHQRGPEPGPERKGPTHAAAEPAHDEIGNDPHIWLDPRNAKAMTAEMARVAGELWPQHAATFAANAAKVSAELDALSAEIARGLAPIARRPFIVFHDAYQYFETRYGIAATGSITIDPDIPPGPRRLSDLRAKIFATGAACVFLEPQFDPKVVYTVVEGSRARVGTLDPLGVTIPGGSGAYTAMMRRLASDLRSCLDDRG